MEAHYNNIAPYNERALTALHELAHVAGFMREEEANFIAFLAARESGDTELMYAAYLDIFNRIVSSFSDEIYEQLPLRFKELFDRLAEQTNSEWQEWHDDEGMHKYFWGGDLLPVQVHIDLDAQNDFWWNRWYSLVLDDEGEVIDVIANPVSEVISDVSSSVNDTYLKFQGQEDGIYSYGRMTDLVYAVYLAEIRD